MRAIGFILIGLLMASGVRAEGIRVSAAISLREAMTEIAARYERETGEKVLLHCGSSGQLAAQIRHGAAVDLFVSAAQRQMDELLEGKLILSETRVVVAGNALVLIVPAKSGDAVQAFADLDKPEVKRIAMGDPKTVPAGEYAQQVLEALKLTAAVKPRLVYGTNARQVLDYVQRGEVSAGMVYATDARQAGEKVRVVANADERWHGPIVYPAAIVARSRQLGQSKAFLKYLMGETAQGVLREKGFVAGADVQSRGRP